MSIYFKLFQTGKGKFPLLPLCVKGTAEKADQEH